MNLSALDQRQEVIPIVGDENEIRSHKPSQDLRVGLTRPTSMRHMIGLEATSVCDAHEFG
ncbi:MAG: hypothetical protein ABI328_00295 [Gemmatimonadaceae bacterium]